MSTTLKLIPKTQGDKKDLADILDDAIGRLPEMKVLALVWSESDGKIMTSWAGGSTLEVAGLAAVLEDSVMLRMSSDD